MKKLSLLFVPIVLVALLIGAFFTFFPLPSDPPAMIPRQELFGNPVKTQPRLSPDGKHIAFLAPDSKDVLNVWVAPTDNLADETIVTNDPKRGVRNLFWQYDGKAILYVQDSDGDENYHLYQTDLATRVTRDLTPFVGVRADVIAYESSHPNDLIVSINQRDRKLFDAYRIDLDTGAVTMEATNPGDVHDWVADNNLHIRAAQAYTADGGTVIRVRDQASNEWRDLLKWGPEEGLGGIAAFSPDNKSLYVLTSQNNDTVRLLDVDVATGKTKELANDKNYDLGSILTHPTDHHLLAVGVERERFGWIPIDDSIKNDFKAIEKFAGSGFQVASRTQDDKTWIVASRHDNKPIEYWLWDRTEQKPKFMFSTMPGLKNYTLVETRPIRIKARDGLKLEGYLTLPAGRKAKNLPTIIYVHGGPWVRDTWGFSPVLQWLANRGYAVLQLNYRGSTGYGKDFVSAGDKEWGAKMQDDILDGKRWLVQKGIANRDKIAIYGGSYGGYATLAGLAFTPNEFCCGVDVVGPSNLLTLLRSLPPYWEAGRALFDRRVGAIDKEDDMLKERSPLFKADQITKPLLIAQGANDPRVKQHESDQIVGAMRNHNKPVEYLVFEDEGHGFARPQNKRRFFAAMEHFLAEHLGGTEEPASPEEDWSSVQR